LTVVGGKGGVGKTTVACALAVSSASAARPVLLVSTDPAPSIADALAQPVDDAAVEVTGAPGLWARQIDAAAAFARFRDAYRDRVQSVFDSLAGGGLDPAHDRRIMGDLLALAPPGIDELYALSELGDALAEDRYAVLVVDPAPTGHLLRLLEMPALALDWSHRLLRLMLKHKAVLELGDAAEALLAFARRTRALQQLLADPDRAGLLAVALDEPLVRAETARLVDEARARAVGVIGVLWNRSASPPEPLPALPPADQLRAPATDPPPRGVAALRAWRGEWTTLSGAGA
jgi:arsenite-transporting ATPase